MNHPSGVAKPSRADELLTKTLKDELALAVVKVLDHFVGAGKRHYRLQSVGCSETLVVSHSSRNKLNIIMSSYSPSSFLALRLRPCSTKPLFL